jgi:hypothetical protein
VHNSGKHERRPVVVNRDNEWEIKTKWNQRRLEKAVAADAVAYRSFSLGQMAGVLYATGALSLALGLTGDLSLGRFGAVERVAFLTLATLTFVGRLVIKRIHSKAGLAKSMLEEQQEDEHRREQSREV